MTETPRAEACGVKLVVKANKKPRKRLRAKARKRVVKTSGTTVARRKRVNAKRNDRVRVAASSGNRKARSGSGTTPRRPVTNKTRTRTVGGSNDSTPTTAKTRTRTPANDNKTNKARTRTPTKVASNPEPKKPERKAEPKKPTRVATADTNKARPNPDRKTQPAPANLPSISVEVYFGYNSFSVEPDAASSLSDVVQWLKDNPRGTLYVFGYADPAGSAAYNQRLSARRARTVQRYLAKEAGVSVKRLRLNPRGERDLAYPEDSPKNRRVVVKTR